MRVDWSGEIPGDLIHLELRGSHIYLEGGRPDWPGRGHEGYGGTFTIEEIRRDRDRFLGDFPGLYDQVMADLAERHRIVDAPTATITIEEADATPPGRVVPFAIDGDRLYVPLDADDVDATIRRSVLARIDGPAAPLTVEVDIRGGDDAWWVRLLGTATLVPPESDWLDDAAELFTWKYPAMRAVVHTSVLCVDIVAWEPDVPCVRPRTGSSS